MNTAPDSLSVDQEETLRLACLHRLGIHQNGPDERLDALTSAAARYFGVPMALITLIDSDRQWIKSNCGIDVQETPRNIAFCHYTIQHQRLLVVENALEDVRFSKNPLVTGPPHIRFYAGAPLLIGGQFRIGSFCLLHDIPRTFDAEARQKLWQFSKIATELIELQHAYAGASSGQTSTRHHPGPPR
ncbi:MAG: GAF domain-containing protein [Hyphomonas sp.]